MNIHSQQMFNYKLNALSMQLSVHFLTCKNIVHISFKCKNINVSYNKNIQLQLKYWDLSILHKRFEILWLTKDNPVYLRAFDQVPWKNKTEGIFIEEIITKPQTLRTDVR